MVAASSGASGSERLWLVDASVAYDTASGSLHPGGEFYPGAHFPQVYVGGRSGGGAGTKSGILQLEISVFFIIDL